MFWQRLQQNTVKKVTLCVICAVVFYATPNPNPNTYLSRRVRDKFTNKGKYIKEPPDESAKLLVVSSLPRSGSSMTGVILSSFSHKSVYFFEPLYYLRQTPCINNQACITKFLQEIFLCKLSDSFLTWFVEDRPEFFKFYSRQTRSCYLMNKKKGECNITREEVVRLCKESDIRIIKVIRLRVSFTQQFFLDKSSDVKVIHLLRDPRGVLFSMRKFPTWEKRSPQRCASVYDDIVSYDILHVNFPKRIHQIYFERLAKDPYRKTAQIFSFINNNQTFFNSTKEAISFLPKACVLAIDLLNPEASNNLANDEERSGDLTEHYADWRWNIPQKLLTAVEEEPFCKKVLSRLGHMLYNTTESCSNRSLHLIIQ